MDHILEIRDLCKYFGPTIANNHINLDLRRGEIHGLAGENGSGKSTLLQQISGIYQKDEGTFVLNGREYDPKSPVDARKNKIGIVVQEIGVLNTLPAGANVFAGNWSKYSKFGMINVKKMYREANGIFEKYGLSRVDLKGDCEEMPIESRKMIELARALSDEPDILILDEVTQSLSQNNREMLCRLIKRLQEEGTTIIMITHDLEEMLDICDRMTVLRDGMIVATEETKNLTVDQIKQMMVGRKVSSNYYRTDYEPRYEDQVVLRVDGVNVPHTLHNISFELHKGEILGFCGLSDSGIHDIGSAAMGLIHAKKGKVILYDKDTEIEISNERIAGKNNIAYVPKDRDGAALMIKDNLLNNFVLPSTPLLKSGFGYMSPKRLKKFTQRGIEEFQVKCSGPGQKMSDLSGGNKQKINLGRWLLKKPRVLILDCPTRGVDVSVKAYIYEVMNEVKATGASMILISDELSEVLGMADRILVMKNGAVSGEFVRGRNFTQEELIEVMV